MVRFLNLFKPERKDKKDELEKYVMSVFPKCQDIFMKLYNLWGKIPDL